MTDAAPSLVPATDMPAVRGPSTTTLMIVLAVVAALVVALLLWAPWRDRGPGPGFVSGNGRLEAVEIDVATRLGGRLATLLVAEGEMVHTGQPLGRIATESLEAQRDEARAQSRQAVHAVASAAARVAARRSEQVAAVALVAQRASELDLSRRHLDRIAALTAQGTMSEQVLDDDRAKVSGAVAVAAGAQAQVVAAEAGIAAAEAEAVGADFAVAASLATIARFEADLADCVLVSPRDARVQYLIAQPGEVVPAGGKVLNLADIGDVTMTFFLPETVVGRIALGSEVRIVLDAAPELVIPAQVSFIAAIAQFTPKTVETKSERQKLMFRVKARIARELLMKHAGQVKTGLPGLAWLRVNPDEAWPERLAVKVPE